MATSPPARLNKFKSPIVLLAVAALMAAAVAWFAYVYLQQREASMKAEIAAKGKRSTTPMVTVAVPVSDAKEGTVLNRTNFVSRPVEADLIYPDSILADDFLTMEGMKLARPVLRGRPLRLTDLMAPEVRDVATILPAGQRALTIEIDNVNSIAQTLRPNHRIDLFLLSKVPKRPQGSNASDGAESTEADIDQASLYMQDLVVLATGTDFQDVNQPDIRTANMVRPGEIQGKEKSFDTVTVLVSPREAARLLIGQKMGTYRIALRGSTDRAPVALAAVRGTELLPGARRDRNAGIEFIVGGKEKLISQLSVPPSMDMARALRQAGSQNASATPIAGSTQGMPSSDTSDRNPAPTFQLTPVTRANSPVPALRR